MREYIKIISSHSLIYGLGTIAPRFVSFLLIPVYTRFLTPADYGILSIAMATLFLLTGFYELGQKASLQRFFHDFDDSERKKFVGTIWIFEIGYAISLALVLTFFGSSIFSLFVKNVQFYPYIAIVVWSAFFLSFGLFPQALLRMEKKPVYFVFLEGTRAFLSTIAILYFVVFLRMGASGALLGTLVASIIIFVFYLRFIASRSIFKFDWDMLKLSILFGVPLVPHIVAGWVLTFADRIMIERFSGLSQVGLYSLGYNFGLIISIVVTSINLAWIPFFYETVKEKGKAAPKIFSKLITYYFLIISFTALALSLGAREILVVFATPKFFAAEKVIPIIALSYLFQGMYFMVANPLFLKKKTVRIALTTSFIALFNVGLNFVLIPIYGIVGAAWATAIAFFALFLIIYLISRREYYIPYNWLSITKASTTGILIFFVSLLVPPEPLWLAILIKGLLLASFLPLLLILRFFSKEETREIKRTVGLIFVKVRGR